MKAVLQWVLRTMMKDQTGVMRTLPKKDLVDFNVAMTAERLMRNGVDPNSLKNANQVENALNAVETAEKANLAKNIRGGIGSTKSAKIMDMEGKEIDPRSKIMGGKQSETEAEIAERLQKENKEGIARIRAGQKMLDDAIDNQSPSLSGDTRTDAVLVAEDLAERMGKVYDDLPIREQTKLYDQAYQGLSKQRFKNRKKPDDADDQESSYDDGPADFDPDADDPNYATGGRAGFKDGMTRRTFLKLLGGMAAVPIVGKFFKLAKVGKTMKEVPMIKTDNVPGKPEWFDALVNKVIVEGDDVTKKFATKEREIVHAKQIDEDNYVTVTQDLDEGVVRVEYESPTTMFGDKVDLRYKKPPPDEGDPRPVGEFQTEESGIVGRAQGPDDYDLEIEGMSGRAIEDLESDVSKLKEYATGKKLTMKEIVEAKKRKDKVRYYETPEGQSEYVVQRQGEADDYYTDVDDFASGGIARLLGE